MVTCRAWSIKLHHSWYFEPKSQKILDQRDNWLYTVVSHNVHITSSVFLHDMMSSSSSKKYSIQCMYGGYNACDNSFTSLVEFDSDLNIHDLSLQNSLERILIKPFMLITLKNSVLLQKDVIDFDKSVVKFMYPLSGPVGGKTEVHVLGNEMSNIKCRFGDVIVDTLVYDPTHVSCASPVQTDSSQRMVEIFISRNDGEYFRSGYVFEYYEDTELLTVNPPLFSEAGGSSLLVKVDDMLSWSSTGSSIVWCELKLVSNSTVEAQSFRCRVESGEVVKCVTPKSKPGLYELRLSRNGQQYGSSSVYVTSHSMMSVQRIHPASVPSAGDVMITIWGSGFVNSSSLSCRIGQYLVQATFLNESRITCTAPPSLFLS